MSANAVLLAAEPPLVVVCSTDETIVGAIRGPTLMIGVRISGVILLPWMVEDDGEVRSTNGEVKPTEELVVIVREWEERKNDEAECLYGAQEQAQKKIKLRNVEDENVRARPNEGVRRTVELEIRAIDECDWIDLKSEDIRNPLSTQTARRNEVNF